MYENTQDDIDKMVGRLYVEDTERKLFDADRRNMLLMKMVYRLRNSMQDHLKGLWQSSANLSVRFRGRLPNRAESIPLIREEVNELLDELDKLETSSEFASKQNTVDEAVDCFVVIIGSLLASGITIDDFAEGIERVIQKNDSKTLESHYFDQMTGKIRRKNVNV